MDTFAMEKIRNVALFGHGDSGKTSLSEAMLFNAGVIKRMGRVDEGNTMSDFDPDEQKRGLSVGATPLVLEWKDFIKTETGNSILKVLETVKGVACPR